jgi:transposase-like protein
MTTATRTNRLPRTLLEAIRYFEDPDVCVAFVASLRWPDGPVCPSCGGKELSYVSTRRLWQCKNKACKRQFSVKVGSIFEDSPIGLDKWIASVWLIANSKNGISSHELGRAIGLTQKSAWFVLHRVRLAMQEGSFEKFSGEIEVDETFIGGKAKFMHAKERKRKISGSGVVDKTAVLGMKERESGQVRAMVVPGRGRLQLQPRVRASVEEGSMLYTDQHHGYTGELEDDYGHEVVDHAVQYVNGRVHTNGIENFWSLLKRGLKGTYVQVAPFHLFRYLDERVFAFNQRTATDFERFGLVLEHVAGRRLTYAKLTGKA